MADNKATNDPTGSGDYLALKEVRDLIQAAIDDAVKPLQDQIADLTIQLTECVKHGQWIALRMAGPTPDQKNGLVLSAEDGGPSAEGERAVLRGRPHISAWESLLVEKGAW